ncbi:MAG: helix-turn-helix domain-containing protein [Acidobacteriota bacterium]
MTHRIATAIYDGLLAFEHSIAAEIFGWERPGLGVDWYQYKACRIEDGPLHSSHGMRFDPPGDLLDVERADTILIPGWRSPLEPPPTDFLDILVRAHGLGKRLVSICTGAFALAHAGLLDGRRSTTHWMHVPKLKKHFPRTLVDEDALYVHDGEISTSAGSAAGLDLSLAIVRQDFGIRVANTIARRMVAPVHREGGQSQYVEIGKAATEPNGFGKVLDTLLDRLDEELPVEQLACEFGYTLRTFQRRFREITGLSPHRWISQQRVVKARELLEQTDFSIEQVASRSGLGSAANLRKHLARHLATTPRAYRSAFRAEDRAGC